MGFWRLRDVLDMWVEAPPSILGFIGLGPSNAPIESLRLTLGFRGLGAYASSHEVFWV